MTKDIKTGTSRIVVLLIILSFLGCTINEKSNFILKGSLIGDFKGYIYLKYDDRVDSCLVQNKSFIFKGNIYQPSEGILFPANPASKESMTVGVIMLENSEISVFLNYDKRNSNMGMTKFLVVDSIKGSKSQVLKDDFESKLNRNVYGEENDSIKNIRFYDNLFEFAKTNPTSILSGNYLASEADFYDLSLDQIDTLLKLMDTTYQDKNNLGKIRNLIKSRKLLLTGEIPPKFLLPDTNGEMIGYESFKGKFVLLEFWASWCAPCRQTNPDLLKVYRSFKGDNFEIIGISIDNKIDQWQGAIKKDSIAWVNVIDTTKTVIENFKITGIPFNILLDRQGKILDKNLRPTQLNEVLNAKL